MGYYTRFELETDDIHGMTACPTCGTLTHVDHSEEIAKMLDGYNPIGDGCKWYSWKEDMIKYSRKYPDLVFTLSGEGEESGDVWKAYFKNGKAQVERAEIQIGAFDVTKLI